MSQAVEKMEEKNGNEREIYLSNQIENSQCEASTNQHKPVQNDKVYERIRGHERHILFHFFTLFMISFMIGVLFIHLSLWMNGHLISSSDHWQGKAEQTCDDTEPLYDMLKRTFQYTGNYFNDVTVNLTISFPLTR